MHRGLAQRQVGNYLMRDTARCCRSRSSPLSDAREELEDAQGYEPHGAAVGGVGGGIHRIHDAQARAQSVATLRLANGLGVVCALVGESDVRWVSRTRARGADAKEPNGSLSSAAEGAQCGARVIQRRVRDH